MVEMQVVEEEELTLDDRLEAQIAEEQMVE